MIALSVRYFGLMLYLAWYPVTCCMAVGSPLGSADADVSWTAALFWGGGSIRGWQQFLKKSKESNIWSFATFSSFSFLYCLFFLLPLLCLKGITAHSAFKCAQLVIFDKFLRLKLPYIRLSCQLFPGHFLFQPDILFSLTNHRRPTSFWVDTDALC